MIVSCNGGNDVSSKLPYYEGNYTVTPQVNSQTLQTEEKSMRENVEVLGIPKSEVSNPYGKTVTIG